MAAIVDMVNGDEDGESAARRLPKLEGQDVDKADLAEEYLALTGERDGKLSILFAYARSPNILWQGKLTATPIVLSPVNYLYRISPPTDGTR